MTTGFQRMIQNSSNKKNLSKELNYLNHLYTHVPQIVMTNYGIHFKSLACGKNHSMALSAKGKLYLWGDNSYSQLSIYQNSSPRYREISTPPSLRIGLKGRSPNTSQEGISSPSKIDTPANKSSYSKEVKRVATNFISLPTLHPKFGQYDFIQSKQIFCSEYSSGVLSNMKI